MWPMGLLLNVNFTCKSIKVYFFQIYIYNDLQVSGLLETPNSKRRIATISDTSGQIEVKMWGPKKDLITQAGIQVKITGLRIDIFNTRYSLNSTSSTAIEVLIFLSVIWRFIIPFNDVKKLQRKNYMVILELLSCLNVLTCQSSLMLIITCSC